jgi:hypothetical protein
MEVNMERELRIESGGAVVDLNAFAKRIVLGTLLGLLGALHGVDSKGEIRITVAADGAPVDTTLSQP